MDEFVLQKKAEGLSTSELYIEFNKKFPGSKTKVAVQTRISKDLKCTNHINPPKDLIKPRANQYTPEMRAYLYELAEGRTLKQITEEFRKRYPEKSERSVHSYIVDSTDIRSDPEALKEQAKTYGRKRWFPKGLVPHNKTPIGTISIRTNKYGNKYKYIKVREETPPQRNYVFLHRYVWEQHNGPIPEGALIMFKDGNSLNCDINNLILVNNARELRYAQPYLGLTDEMAEAGVKLAQLKNLIVEKEKENESNS